MVDPVNHTVGILQDIRGALRVLDARVAAMDERASRPGKPKK
jgi:hypothetical protein